MTEVFGINRATSNKQPIERKLHNTHPTRQALHSWKTKCCVNVNAFDVFNSKKQRLFLKS